MSLVTYTSFPRALGMCPSEIKGREKEFGINYDISPWQDYHGIFLLPNKSPKESNILLEDKRNARNDFCFDNETLDYFDNKFVYHLLPIGIPDDTEEERLEIIKKYTANEHWFENITKEMEKHHVSDWPEVMKEYADIESIRRELRKYQELDWIKERQALHDFINEHINCGEFVEEYIVWDNHDGTVFGPPTIEQSMTLQEYLNEPISMALDLSERYKRTIYK